MFKTLKKRLKEQKGFTLIELLAVIVILGIIAAIAIPSIGGIIKNSKSDAHIANAEQLVNATRTAVAANDTAVIDDNKATLTELQTAGYLENVDSPTTAYDPEATLVNIISNATNGTFTYTVVLKAGSNTTSAKAASDLTRADVDDL